jgi:mannitol/fructose-specific phosphotransferase system IIA component (Ntr-type)
MGFTDYLIREKAIVCRMEAHNWEEAVLKGGEILISKGLATPAYLASIVEKCRDNGPYIVIAPGIAMPHARPEEGALALGYALVTLKTPVVFQDPDNDPISLLIYLTAPDMKSHTEEAVSQVADLCDDEKLIKALMRAEKKEKILMILENYRKKERFAQ